MSVCLCIQCVSQIFCAVKKNPDLNWSTGLVYLFASLRSHDSVSLMPIGYSVRDVQSFEEDIIYRLNSEQPALCKSSMDIAEAQAGDLATSLCAEMRFSGLIRF